MAKSINDILYRFMADTKSLDKGNRKAQGGFKDTQKGAGRVAGALTGVQKAFVAVGGAYAASRVGEFVIDATNMAAKAEQVAGSFNQVFGPAADNVRQKLEDMRASVGLNALEFEELLTQNGNLLRGFGVTEEAVGGLSEELFGAAADLAAFKGDTGLTEEALHALNRALVGEFDPLEQFIGGVKASTIATKALEMGLAETVGELTEQDKALALLEIVTSDANLATGAFADTQGTLQDQTNRANVALEDAKLALGEALAPAVLAATENTVQLYEALGVLSKDTADASEKVGALGRAWDATGGQFSVTLSEIREEFDLWIGRFKSVDEWFDRLRANIAGGIPNPFKGWRLPRLPSSFNPVDWVRGRAAGGPVTGNTPYIVGEKGPELMVPGRSGTVMPNHQLGGGGVVNVNVSFNGVVGDPVEVAGQIQDLIDLYGRTNGLP